MISLISEENIETSLNQLTKYIQIQVYRSWFKTFVAFGLANLFTCLVIIISASIDSSFLSTNLWIILPLVNIPVIYGTMIILISYKYELIDTIVEKKFTTLEAVSSPKYWKGFVIGFIWLNLSASMNLFSYQRYTIGLSDQFLWMFPFTILGLSFVIIYFVQKYVYPKFYFKEFLFFGLFFIGISIIIFLAQGLFIVSDGNLFKNLFDVLNNKANANELFSTPLNFFFFEEIIVSLVMIIIGITQHFKIKIYSQNNER